MKCCKGSDKEEVFQSSERLGTATAQYAELRAIYEALRATTRDGR